MEEKEKSIMRTAPQISRYENDENTDKKPFFKAIIFKRPKKMLIAVSLIIILLLIITILIESAISPHIIALCENAARQSIDQCINESIEELAEKGFSDYGKLISLKYDKSGKISSITVNTKNALLLRTHFEKTLNEKLSENRNIKVKIPFGSLLGINLFSDKGIKISISLSPISSSIGELKSDMLGQGINQISHKLYIEADIGTVIVIPGRSFTKEYTRNILIAENIIMGEVPEFYLKK